MKVQPEEFAQYRRRIILHAAYLAGDNMGRFNEFMKHMPISAAHIASYECKSEGQWLMRVGSASVS